MNLNKQIAIIILNWNTYEYTLKCILSLKKNDFQNFQIIVVDNGSNDNSITLLKEKFDDIKYIINSNNLGFSGGNNQGIKYALENKFEYLMLLNNDTEVNKNFFPPLLNSLQSNHLLGAVQPLIMNFNNKEKVWNAGGYLNNFFGVPYTNKKLNDKNQQIDWITGCCILLKANVIKKTGLIDENFFAYYEDVDWSLRIRSIGYSLGLQSNSIIYHHGSESSKKNNIIGEGSLSPYVHYLNIRNHIYLVKKHSDKFNFIGVLFYQFLKILFYSIYFILRLRFSKLKMVYKGLNDGINNKQIKK